jgi:hypothetical protein
MTRPMLLLLLIASGVCVPHQSWAQVSIGARGGIVYSWPSTNPMYPPTSMTSETVKGSEAGLVVEIRLADHVSFLLEPGYIRKGMKVGWQYTVYGYDFDRRAYFPAYTLTGQWSATADYLELPLSLKMSFLDGPVRPYLIAGSAIAYKMKESFTSTGSEYYDNLNIDMGFYTRYDVTLQLGAGISYLFLDPVSIFTDGRYSVGLNNIDLTGRLGMKSAEWRISGGIMVEL